MKVEAGWIPAYEYVGSLVYVRAIEILLDPSARVREGDVIVFLQQVGRLKLGETELCTQNPPHYSAAAGDSLLLVGAHDPTNDGMVSTGRRFVFKIEDGLVLSPFEPAPTLLDEVRRGLGEMLLQEP